jgi:hypothetical protein
MIMCRGVGLEPQLIIGQMRGTEFEPTTSIVFNPILTHSQGDEQEIVIRNPCTFPIEIYNLEFDEQYLKEEKVIDISHIDSTKFLYRDVFSSRSFDYCLAMMKTIIFFYQHGQLVIDCRLNY